MNIHGNEADAMNIEKYIFDSHAQLRSSMIRTMKPTNVANTQKYIIEDNNIGYSKTGKICQKLPLIKFFSLN